MVHNSKSADSSLDALDDLLGRVRRGGADAADAVLFRSAELQTSTRKLMPEGIERSESSVLGLRAWVGDRQAIVSSTDLSPALFDELAERVVGMARIATPDPDATLAQQERLATKIPALDLYDGDEPGAEWLMAQCRACEEAALSVPGITNSEGSDASYSSSRIALVTRPASGTGFAESYAGSYFSQSASVLAGTGTAMERDYDYAMVRHRKELPLPESIGKAAAERALKRLGARKVDTCQAPVVFDPRVARSLVSCFTSAINGAAIARGTSFLKDALGAVVFAPSISIIDDPLRMRGLASRPFDGEGVATKKLELVKDGVVQSWVLDTRTANKLKLATTGHASRGAASAPSPATSNVSLQPGKQTPAQLMAEIKSGLYVTEAFGMGVNLVTGDYSQGVSGFWIENGVLAFPVSEMTIAGNMRDMFANLAAANDLEFRYTTNAPTLRVERMTVAGA